jgi:hypothetical protein
MRYAGAKRFIQPKQGAFLGLWLNKEDLYKKNDTIPRFGQWLGLRFLCMRL